MAETASQWETVDATQRQAIREAMRDATRARLQANDWAVELVDFWLWGVAVPARLDVAIERKLEVEQLQITALNQQAIAFVHADTEVLTNLTLLSAARLHDEASADARRVVGGARAARFGGVTSALALDGSPAQSLDWAAATMRWLWWSVAAEVSTRVVLPPTASGAASSVRGAPARSAEWRRSGSRIQSMRIQVFSRTHPTHQPAQDAREPSTSAPSWRRRCCSASAWRGRRRW